MENSNLFKTAKLKQVWYPGYAAWRRSIKIEGEADWPIRFGDRSRPRSGKLRSLWIHPRKYQSLSMHADIYRSLSICSFVNVKVQTTYPVSLHLFLWHFTYSTFKSVSPTTASVSHANEFQGSWLLAGSTDSWVWIAPALMHVANQHTYGAPKSLLPLQQLKLHFSSYYVSKYLYS